MNNKSNPIYSTKVKQSQRMAFLPKHTGRNFLRFESLIYSTMSSVCAEYNGGYWDFFDLSNGGFYMAMDLHPKISIFVDGNGYDGRMSSDAAGIVATLFALNRLIWVTESDELCSKYELLLDYAEQHKESGKIFAAID